MVQPKDKEVNMSRFVHIFLLRSYLVELTQGKLEKLKSDSTTDDWSIVRFPDDKPKAKGVLMEYTKPGSYELKEAGRIEGTKTQLLKELEGQPHVVEDCNSRVFYKACGCTVITSWNHTRDFQTGGRENYWCPTCDSSSYIQDRDFHSSARRLAFYKYSLPSSSTESYFPLSGTFCKIHEEKNSWVAKATERYLLRPTEEAKEELLNAIDKFFRSRKEKLPPFREIY